METDQELQSAKPVQYIISKYSLQACETWTEKTVNCETTAHSHKYNINHRGVLRV